MKARAKKNGYVDWETPEGLEKITGWASQGLTKEQIANNMGIHRCTLVDWRKESSLIDNAIKKGEEAAIDTVENALFSAAVSGNITAQIFFLKNRRPDAWKDKRDTEITGNGGKMTFSWQSDKDKAEAKGDV